MDAGNVLSLITCAKPCTLLYIFFAHFVPSRLKIIEVF